MAACARGTILSRSYTMKKTMLAILALTISGFTVCAQTSTLSETDRDAIKATALDYIEGWYEGNPERMERALHPDLAKRMVMTNPEGRSMLQQMSAMGLVQGVKRGGGKNTPKENQLKEVTI